MMHPPPHSSRRAFTLVELSIVLVVIGLLVAGIAVGKNMIRAAQLRSVITDANLYLNAVNNFRSQYKYLPGDMPNATNYWGLAGGSAAANDATCNTVISDQATCNGDADGIVSRATGEEFRFWQHLRNAGMIDAKLNGVAGGGGATDSTPAINVPASRVANTGYSFFNFVSTNGADSYIYMANYGNMLTYGSTLAGSEPITAALTAADAYTLDQKADDGLPMTGKWMANSTGGGTFSTANACTTSTGAQNAGAYNLTNTAVSCSFFILSGY